MSIRSWPLTTSTGRLLKQQSCYLENSWTRSWCNLLAFHLLFQQSCKSRGAPAMPPPQEIGTMVVNSPLIRPAISWVGKRGSLGGVPLGSHEFSEGFRSWTSTCKHFTPWATWTQVDVASFSLPPNPFTPFSFWIEEVSKKSQEFFFIPESGTQLFIYLQQGKSTWHRVPCHWFI